MHKSYLICLLLLLTACNDYLDVVPDNRALLDNPAKIKKLLNTSYPQANYALLAEFSSDNIVDNNTNPVNRKLPFERMDDEIFAWQAVRSSDYDDSPYFVWEEYYHSIAAANHALAAIERLEKEGHPQSMDAQKGEALLLRAYCHFVLANIFCQAYKDEEASRQDAGIPYLTEVEVVVNPIHDRGTVAGVYAAIQKDIEAGLNLIDDSAYSIPQYHFNRKAAHAFAARFYLFKREYEKTVKHATAVLGDNPADVLRNWTTTYNGSDAMANAYVNTDEQANLLLLPTHSAYFRRFNSCRYGSYGEALKGSYTDRGPTWDKEPPFLLGWVREYEYGFSYFIAKVKEMFEFTDKVAMIGYAHVTRTEFTTDATLLDRAEAYIYLNRADQAATDLQTWNAGHKGSRELTPELIREFYTTAGSHFSKAFHTTELSPHFIVTEEQKPYVDCVLHFRRLERAFEGDRWFDIKRYGIELEHHIGPDGNKETLTWNDPRRAIQLPQDVIGAGLDANPIIREYTDHSLNEHILSDTPQP